MPDSERHALKHVLIAEPDVIIGRRLKRAFGPNAHVTTCADFVGARSRLLEDEPDLLITNLRLAEYNGLHLIIVNQFAEHAARCIVHTDRPDLFLISEAQRSGALYERTERLPFAVKSYLYAPWPQMDRRDPTRPDRRSVFRGGRRASDQAEIVSVG